MGQPLLTQVEMVSKNLPELSPKFTDLVQLLFLEAPLLTPLARVSALRLALTPLLVDVEEGGQVSSSRLKEGA